jgi:hypothetical protein
MSLGLGLGLGLIDIGIVLPSTYIFALVFCVIFCVVFRFICQNKIVMPCKSDIFQHKFEGDNNDYINVMKTKVTRQQQLNHTAANLFCSHL